MKRIFLALTAMLLLVACDRSSDRPLIERAFLALPENAFTSLASDIAPAAAREAIVRDREYATGGNEDAHSFSLNYDTDLPDELTVSCFCDPVFCYVQLHAYKMQQEDQWFILTDVGEMVAEAPMRSLLTHGYQFDAKKGTLTEVGLLSEAYSNQDFYDPIASWPYIKSGKDVKSTHVVVMPWGYYVNPNITDEAGVQDSMNSTPFALKYVWNGSAFQRKGYGPALLFVDCLGKFSVTEQPEIPSDFEFPGCHMEMTSEEGYNNVPVRHFDIYQDEEHLIRLDPFPGLGTEEGRFLLMQVRVFSPRYRTSEGFGVDTPLQEIRTAASIYNMDRSDLILTDTTTDDGRAALSIGFEGYEAETLFVTDAPDASAPDAKTVEVLIRPIAKG